MLCSKQFVKHIHRNLNLINSRSSFRCLSVTNEQSSFTKHGGKHRTTLIDGDTLVAHGRDAFKYVKTPFLIQDIHLNSKNSNEKLSKLNETASQRVKFDARRKTPSIQKANIMRLGNGLFNETSPDMTRLYPTIKFHSMTNTSMQKSAKMSSSGEFKRLPTSIIPINYQVTLKPDLEKFTFDGQVVIDVDVKEATDTVLLNSAELKFDKATVQVNEQLKYESTSVTLDETNEVATIKFALPLPLGQTKLSINYTGILNDNLKGFYRSKYTHPSGVVKYAATTQFEPADCRRALPCWDEPAHKATFDVIMIADGDKTVLSNMPLVERKDYEGDSKLKKFIFERTPKMSTYLLAFVVGEYDYIEAKDSNGILIRVYTPLGKKEFGRFALDVSLKTLPFYTNYFGIGYPLPKLDLIAIADFSAGAMENWGLVTYRETALLIDPDNSSVSTKQRVAIVVGHEIAHQWFGNIVTMEWWTHLWLNEGFASWIEYLCVDHCLPEFDIWTHFVTSDWCRALELDGRKNSHAIEVPVGPPSEINEIFDAISYSKGASVIRMLHAYIGDDAFRKGLNEYLEKFKYKNALTEDLWESLGKASQKPINDLMTLWTKQVGYPVINVTRSVNADKHTILKLTQERFFFNGDKPTDSENNLWKVPISIVTKSSFPNVHKQILLEKFSDEVDLGVMDDSEWIKLNKNSIGFYRTNYSDDLMDKLIEQVRDKTLHPTDRLGLQSDVFSLAQAGRFSTAKLLEFLEAYENEDNVTVWTDLLSNVLHLSGLLLNADFHDKFRSYIRKLVKPISKKLGWEPIPGESSLQAMCRGTILRTLAINEDEETIKHAKELFSKHLSGEISIPADLRSAVYAANLLNADENTLKTFMDLHDKSDLQEEKMRIASNLAVVKNPELVKKVLDFSLSPSVRSQDSAIVICAVAGSTTNNSALDLTWSFCKDKWTLLHERYQGGFMMSRLVKTTEGFCCLDKHKECEEFFKTHPITGAERSAQQSLESIKVHATWLARDKEAVKAFLAKY